MSFRKSVERWHGGQLVIAWVGMVVTLALVIGIHALAISLVDDSKTARIERDVDRLYQLDSVQRHYDDSVARAQGLPDFSYVNPYRKRFANPVRDSVTTVWGNHFSPYYSFLFLSGAVLSLITAAIPFIWTWWWLGARSPRQSL